MADQEEALRNRISHKKQLVLAFFVGGATSAIAFDLSDYIFYQQSTGSTPLSPFMQAFLFAGFPAIYYFMFAAIGYAIFKFTHVGAEFIIYFYAATILFAAILAQSLPQNIEPFFTSLVWIGVFVSLGVIYGLLREVRGR
jgi:hypothetical protein